MCNQNTILRDFDDAFGNLVEFRRRFQHGVVDSGQFHDKRLDRDFRIHQRYELVDDFVSVEPVYSDFGDAFFVELAAGGFYVEDCVDSAGF